jgi:hypothetical protein
MLAMGENGVVKGQVVHVAVPVMLLNVPAGHAAHGFPAGQGLTAEDKFMMLSMTLKISFRLFSLGIPG